LSESTQNNESRRQIGEYFRELRLTNDFLMLPEERTWLTRQPQNPESKKVVLYLGCNVLRTPHMVQTVTDIFQRLGVDFVAVGGSTYCCGAPFRQDFPEEALALGERSVQYFNEFRPGRVVMWCPGCLAHYTETLASRFACPVQHVSEFLAENLDRFPHLSRVPKRVALHYHSREPASERQAASARRLLQAVPGLELVEVGTDPRLGRQCTLGARQTLGGDLYDGILESQIQRAVQSKADVFATLYHGCHRVLVHYQRRYPLQVEHYLSLLGEALGIAHEDRYRRYAMLADTNTIIEAAAPFLSANQVDPETARRVVQRIFVDRKGP